jgi:beta-glucosidase
MKLQLAGAKSVMISSGEINGTPIHSSEYLLCLEKKKDFKVLLLQIGKILSISIRDTKWPKPIEMPFELLLAGIDMSMVPENYSFCTDLLDLVIKGEVPMSRIDVSRI